MPRVSKTAHEMTTEPLEENSLLALQTSYPMMVCGVNRKFNAGNFETIDIYSAVTVPVLAHPEDGAEEFKQAAQEAAATGFAIVSKETGDRYTMLRDLQEGAPR